jgi:hypothetical protein
MYLILDTCHLIPNKKNQDYNDPGSFYSLNLIGLFLLPYQMESFYIFLTAELFVI